MIGDVFEEAPSKLCVFDPLRLNGENGTRLDARRSRAFSIAQRVECLDAERERLIAPEPSNLRAA